MNVLQLLLTEAADLSSGEKIYKALQKGMVPGVKAKIFLANVNSDEAIKALNKIAGVLKNRISAKNYNSAIFLLLKKAQNVNKLIKRINVNNDISFWIDPLLTYFNNRNKQEVKTNSEIANRFKNFENSPLSYPKDKEFEQWVNEKFAAKAKMKEIDAKIVYPKDGNGWEIIIPKTFAAAKKYACMADRKAKWCTSASPKMFKLYSSPDNPLYIIRNDKKNIMYQMDWGKFGSPNFKNEKDFSVTIDEFMNHNPPKKMLNSLKNKEGETLGELIAKSIKEREVKHEKEKGVWKEKSAKDAEARKALSPVLIYFTKQFGDISDFLSYYFTQSVNIEDAMRTRKEKHKLLPHNPFSKIKDHLIIKNKEQNHYYVILQGRIFKHGVGILENPIIKLSDDNKVLGLVSRTELEKDIGNLPERAAKMVSKAEKIKEEPTLKPIKDSKKRGK